jgi:hypothetical protein
MRTGSTTTVRLLLSVLILLVATGCGVVERVSEQNGESVRDNLAERSESAVARLSSVDRSSIERVFSGAVTLGELHRAGVEVGSEEIDCDQPLHIVVLGGLFDSDDLFGNAIRLAGGTEEALAMRLVAEIYDPETEMPLGMIGDSTGSALGQISGGTSFSSPATGGEMMLNTTGTNGNGSLIPEAICR